MCIRDRPQTEPKEVKRTEYLPGEVVVQPIPDPDSSLVQDCDPLTEEFIPAGPDIEAKAAIATASAWAGQYHECEIKYYTLRGWLIGVRDAQNSLNGTAPGQFISDPP